MNPRRLCFTYTLIFLITAGLALTGCSGDWGGEAKYPTGADRRGATDNIYAKKESIFGEGGIFGKKDDSQDGGGSGIAVNSFLWRASLDTVSFMPLASADPFGGTILTDWYVPDDKGNERFKLNVFILTRELRSDGVRVRMFRQIRKNGTWVDVTNNEAAARQLEDAILTRARQLRIAQVQQ